MLGGRIPSEVREMEAACWRDLKVRMPGGLNELLSDPNFRRKLLKRIEEGWTFEKIEPMSAEEIFARLNRLGVIVTPDDFRQAAQRHDSAVLLADEWNARYVLHPWAATTRISSGWRPSCSGNA